MSLTNRVTIAIEVYKDGAKLDGGSEALNALIATIPFAGGAITSILSGRAQRQMRERVNDVFEAFKERLEQMEAGRIDKNYFESDEFLTLFTLTLEQTQTTHDKAKLKMLATGLANSAKSEFTSELRKELFLRIIRDLAPQDIGTLKGMVITIGSGIPASPGDHLVTLQRLTAHGLVSEDLQTEKLPTVNLTHPGSQHILKNAFERSPSKYYSISDFGRDFLRFFETETSQ
jgi:hypothetical protein